MARRSLNLTVVTMSLPTAFDKECRINRPSLRKKQTEQTNVRVLQAMNEQLPACVGRASQQRLWLHFHGMSLHAGQNWHTSSRLIRGLQLFQQHVGSGKLLEICITSVSVGCFWSRSGAIDSYEAPLSGPLLTTDLPYLASKLCIGEHHATSEGPWFSFDLGKEARHWKHSGSRICSRHLGPNLHGLETVIHPGG